MNGPNMLGLIGALISGYAYWPQIHHLVQEHCSAGISRRAYALWLVSSLLITSNALYIHSPVFIFLGCIQILSTAIIYLFSSKYAGQTCAFHTHVIAAQQPKK